MLKRLKNINCFKNIKKYLSENFYKHFKKIVERTGIWLIALLNITIPVIIYFCGAIDIVVLRNAAEAAYIATIQYMCFGIGKLFKNGYNNHTSADPQ